MRESRVALPVRSCRRCAQIFGLIRSSCSTLASNGVSQTRQAILAEERIDNRRGLARRPVPLRQVYRVDRRAALGQDRDRVLAAVDVLAGGVFEAIGWGAVDHELDGLAQSKRLVLRRFLGVGALGQEAPSQRPGRPLQLARSRVVTARADDPRPFRTRGHPVAARPAWADGGSRLDRGRAQSSGAGDILRALQTKSGDLGRASCYTEAIGSACGASGLLKPWVASFPPRGRPIFGPRGHSGGEARWVQARSLRLGNPQCGGDCDPT